MFTNQRIEKFLEKGLTEEVKNDKSYDPFRYLMNERNMAFDQDLYATDNRDKTDSKYFSVYSLEISLPGSKTQLLKLRGAIQVRMKKCKDNR
jgi:hypothetical protein